MPRVPCGGRGPAGGSLVSWNDTCRGHTLLSPQRFGGSARVAPAALPEPLSRQFSPCSLQVGSLRVGSVSAAGPRRGATSIPSWGKHPRPARGSARPGAALGN